MAVATFQRLDEINADAAAMAGRVHIGRLLLTLVAGVFWALGWVAAKAVFVVLWCFAAAKAGWKDARRMSEAPRGPAG
jgi:hypothetical protein